MECSKAKPVQQTCAICLDRCITFIKLKCNHMYHSECIKEWARESNKCPLCRKFMGYYIVDAPPTSLIQSFSELYPVCIYKN